MSTSATAPSFLHPVATPAPLTPSQKEAAYDAGLVQRFTNGDESAFVEIMERYRTRLFSVALSVLHNRNDAEEMVQDTFIRAHRGLERFRGDSSLATWLHRIALNLSRNRYWYFFRRRRHATLSLDCPLSDGNELTFTDLMASESVSPNREVMIDEFASSVATCMQNLDAPQREILSLRNIKNRSYAEISHELGINVGTVKSRIARARENLRKLLTQVCPEFGENELPSAWFESARSAGGLVAAA
jgi:RNA polymerase sigma-70 factor (ECF subfamily)